MQYIKNFYNFINEDSDNYITLAEAYDYVPDSDEVLWTYVGTDEFENVEFETREESVSRLFHEYYDSSGTRTVEEAYKAHKDEIEGYIDDLRNNIEDILDEYIVVMYDQLVDGHHRTAALYLSGIKTIKVVDISVER